MLNSRLAGWLARCYVVEKTLAVCFHHCVSRSNCHILNHTSPVHTFPLSHARTPVLCVFVRGLRCIYYMSGSSKNYNRDNTEDTNPSITSASTATAAETSITDNQHNSLSSYSDRLKVTKEVPTIAEPLSASEEVALTKWKERLSETGHFYEARFVLGPMCAGKTSIIHEFGCLKQLRHFAYVDTDEIMTSLDGYCDSAIDKFYLSARNVSIHLTDWLLEERMSFIAEGTCVKYLELRDYMIRLKEHGYNIKVVKLDSSPLDLLLERAEKRVRRRVSPDVIRDIYVHSNIGLQKLWEINESEHLFEELVLKK